MMRLRGSSRILQIISNYKNVVIFYSLRYFIEFWTRIFLFWSIPIFLICYYVIDYSKSIIMSLMESIILFYFLRLIFVFEYLQINC